MALLSLCEEEPAIRKLLRMRFGLPLFWARSVIEVTPRRMAYRPGEDTTRAPEITLLKAPA